MESITRRPFTEVLAEAMWQQHAQEKDWKELNPLEQEQMLWEAQYCVETLRENGWEIIAQATKEEFDKAMDRLNRRKNGNADFEKYAAQEEREKGD